MRGIGIISARALHNSAQSVHRGHGNEVPYGSPACGNSAHGQGIRHFLHPAVELQISVRAVRRSHNSSLNGVSVRRLRRSAVQSIVARVRAAQRKVFGQHAIPSRVRSARPVRNGNHNLIARKKVVYIRNGLMRRAVVSEVWRNPAELHRKFGYGKGIYYPAVGVIAPPEVFRRLNGYGIASAVGLNRLYPFPARNGYNQLIPVYGRNEFRLIFPYEFFKVILPALVNCGNRIARNARAVVTAVIKLGLFQCGRSYLVRE